MALNNLAPCGLAFSKAFLEEKFDSPDAWVQSTAKGASLS